MKLALKPPKIFPILTGTGNKINSIPPDFNLEKPIVILTVFEPPNLSSSNGNGQVLSTAFQFALDIFGSPAVTGALQKIHLDLPNGNSKIVAENETVSICGFYNENESVLILNLNSSCAGNCLEVFSESKVKKGFLSQWMEINCDYCRALVLLFTMSHIMILNTMKDHFDTNLINFFRHLDTYRIELKQFMSKILNDIDGLPKQWIENARLCSPRILFFMEVENIPKSKYPGVFKAEPDPFMKLKCDLEDNIYQILRKCRLVTNISGQSMFAIPVDQEDFVFLYDTSVSESCDTLANTFTSFIDNFYEQFTTVGKSPASPGAGLSNLLASKSARLRGEVTHRDFVTRFQGFLLGHIRTALRKGFDDNASRVAEHKHFFVLPNIKQWQQAYENLTEYLMHGKHPDPRGIKALGNIEQYLNIDTEYVEAQCSKMFSKVFSAYTKNVPEFYSEEEHRTRLAQAIDAFLNVTRDPRVSIWLDKLAEKCTQFWKTGHQQCETRSLLNYLCNNPLHRVLPEDHLEVVPFIEMDEDLPEMKHSSGQRLTAFCNCGRRSGIRDAPFTIREGNYEFYQRLGSDCCEKLEKWSPPIFKAQKQVNGQGLTLQEMLKIIQSKSKEPGVSNRKLLDYEEISQEIEAELRQGIESGEESGGSISEDEEKPDVKPISQVDCATETEGKDNDCNKQIDDPKDLEPTKSKELSQSSQRKSSNSNPKEEVVMMSQEAVPAFADINLAQMKLDDSEVKENTQRKQQTPNVVLEYLPGMIHSKSLPGLLPLFPSFSLVRFGPSNVYAHTQGIQYQPGFLQGTNYLLPLDMSVKAELGVSKPIPRMIRGRAPSKQVKRLKDEFNVKVFIGFEYECKKGHRFMLESANKILKFTVATFRPSVREAATKAAASDMPLYFNCPCSDETGKISVAQLMRIHAVTPKAPVFVTINPRIQPGPNPCPMFTPGNKEPIKLNPSTYWVLRLPYCYVSEDQIYVPPMDTSTYNGKLIRGLFQVVSMSTLETLAWEEQNSKLQ